MGDQAADVTVYTLPGCLHCGRARRRLHRHDVAFREISGEGDHRFRDRLLELTGGLTVPQIVIDGEAIGGADELAHLDRRGVLASRLSREASPYPGVRRRLAARKIPAAIAAALFGDDCTPWRWTIELRAADGRTVQSATVAADADEARRVAAALRTPAQVEA